MSDDTSHRDPVGLPHQYVDVDPGERAEWVESFDAVVKRLGPARARFLMLELQRRAAELDIGVPDVRQTDYINTIHPDDEPEFPGDETIEKRIRRYVRWNAAIMVHRAQRPGIGVGGHISSHASSASLYEVGFNHFFKGPPGSRRRRSGVLPGACLAGDLCARVRGRPTVGQPARRVPAGTVTPPAVALPSYPHPRLMPDFWQFPTVSMGLRPIDAIYQARFNRYLHDRGIKDTSQQHVWAFLGDGECDEPETLGKISFAAREGLDNLTFVINCNLQRLDGPVSGNGKIIQELESVFRGAGWNVIKVVWGRSWDPCSTATTTVPSCN